MNVVIRHAIEMDAALLAEIGAKTFYETFASRNTPENMRLYLASSFGRELQAAELEDPDSVFLIAELDGAPCGYAKLNSGAAPSCVESSRPMEIVRIYVLKDHLGKGIGAALMQACLDESNQRGKDVIWLGVWEHNEQAIEFYRKWKFKEVGTHTFQLGNDPQLDLIFQRRIS